MIAVIRQINYIHHTGIFRKLIIFSPKSLMQKHCITIKNQQHPLFCQKLSIAFILIESEYVNKMINDDVN